MLRSLDIWRRGFAIGTVCVSLILNGCGDGDDDSQVATDFVAQASDFECLQNWTRIRNFRLTNKVGLLDEALEVANSPAPGRQFPVGTIMQIFPGEAMVKRGADFDPENNNWEYFELTVTGGGAEIRKRGRDDVINMFGLQCFGCHEAARDFDFICESDHGCIQLPVSGAQIAIFQDLDPRCRSATPTP